VVLGAALAWWGAAGEARAWTVIDQEDTRLKINGLAEAGYLIEGSSAADNAESFGARLGLARLVLRGERAGLGEMLFQLQGEKGAVGVLDLMVGLHPVKPLKVRVGRYKAPLSLERQLRAPELLFSSRGTVSALAPNRLTGAEVEWRSPLGEEVALRAQVGVFQPDGVGLQGDHTQLGTARLLLELPHAVEVHVAYGQHVGAGNRVVGGSERAIIHDKLVDVAVKAHEGPLRLLVEGLAVLEGPAGEREWAAYGELGWRFGLPGGLPALQPAVGADWARRADLEEDTRRLRAALNVIWIQDDLVAQIAYDATLREVGAMHGVVLSLQVGL
jgi:hypothetical protein